MRSFKEEVVLALHNTDWMPTFENAQACAEYLSIEPPETTEDAIDLQQQAMAVLVNKAADHIINATNT